jgi:hypothetical protein
MNPFAIGWGRTMNKPERLHLRDLPKGTEVILEGGTIVLRKVVDAAEVRRACASIRKHLPKPKKGESIARELNRLRIRGGDER